MRTYAEHAQSNAATQAATRTRAAWAVIAHARATAGDLQVPRAARVKRAPADARVGRNPQTMSWRDLVQSFAHDAAEMPIVWHLLAGQVVLALGYASLRLALAQHERTNASPLSTLLLGGLTVGVGVAFAWGALAFVSRTRAAPVVTAFFTYGHALRQYFPPRRPLAQAA